MTLNEFLEVMQYDHELRVYVDEDCNYTMRAGDMGRVIKQYILAQEIDYIHAPYAGCIDVRLKCEYSRKDEKR